MEPAKMKTHHGYFLGKPMSAVGTKLTSQPMDDRKSYLHVISRFG